MSEENVELIRQAFAEYGGSASGWEEVASSGLIAADAEFDISALYPDAPVIHGLTDWLNFVDSLPWGRSTKLEPERFFDVDEERVLIFMRVTAKGEGSGVPVEIRDAHEYTIRDGVLVRMKVYADRAEALEAAGLSA
jgi:ketosteroid isomerase-like protein